MTATAGAALLKILGQYMTETAARVLVRGALDSRGLNADALTARDLPAVVDALGPSLRHFVDASKIDGLRGALRTLVSADGAGETRAPVKLEIKDEADATRARWAARSLCEELGATGFEMQKVATGVSELTRNQLSYAKGGTLELVATRSPRKSIRVTAVDHGPGIASLDLILSGKYRSKTGLGLGLLGIKRMADQFDVKTGPTGTTVVFEVIL